MYPSLTDIKLNCLTFTKGMLHTDRATQFEKQIGHTVINLTDLVFTTNELELFNKGLSFSHSPQRPFLQTYGLT